MLVSEALTKIRDRISDQDAFGYTDSEIINYINDAIAVLWLHLISLGKNEVIKRVTSNITPFTKPSDFYQIIGNPTIIENGDNLENYGKLPIEFCYYAKPSTIATTTDTLPFNNYAYHSAIIQVASMYALNRNEFDISQDKVILDELRALIK